MNAQSHVIFVIGLAQSGVCKSRKFCFTHGVRVGRVKGSACDGYDG